LAVKPRLKNKQQKTTFEWSNLHYSVIVINDNVQTDHIRLGFESSDSVGRLQSPDDEADRIIS